MKLIEDITLVLNYGLNKPTVSSLSTSASLPTSGPASDSLSEKVNLHLGRLANGLIMLLGARRQ